MRNSYLMILGAFGIILGGLFLGLKQPDKKMEYTPREQQPKISSSVKDASDWLFRRRANLNTNSIELKDIINARHEAQTLFARKGISNVNVTWTEAGPDNIGGRTRALIIDRNNNQVLYAGSVSGGLWKTTSSGQNWFQIKYTAAQSNEPANYAISCMAQASNGAIYFGTGEGFYYNSGAGTGGLEGAGIWKSTDGITFNQLTATWNSAETKSAFVNVNEIAIDPSNPDKIYAATKVGLWESTNGGGSWNKLNVPESSYNMLPAQDVKIASDGTLLVSLGATAWLRPAGATNFIKISGLDEDRGGVLISDSAVIRLEFAIAPSNQNYIYCAAINNTGRMGKLRNIYLSTDKGATWRIIGRGGSNLFQPFGEQGFYDCAIAVHPQKHLELFVAGLNVWKGYDVGLGSYQWTQITDQALPDYHPFYVHADQHNIVFDPTNPNVVYVASDGGVARGYYNYSMYIFSAMNRGYSVTQFYSVGFNPSGRIFGGTQDNGSIMINPSGPTPKTGVQILGGDGGWAMGSNLNPNIIFASLYYAGVKRSNELDVNFTDPYDQLACAFHSWNATGGGWEPDPTEGPFVSCFDIWETNNDPYGNDTVIFICKKDYYQGQVVTMRSYNAYEQPVYVTIPRNLHKNDTLKYRDPYATLFTVGAARMVWITRKICNYNVVMNKWDWLPIVTRRMGTAGTGLLYQDLSDAKNHEDVEQIAISADGKHIFFATNFGKLYRSSNVHLARNKDNGSAYKTDGFTTTNPNCVINSQIIADFGNRTVTSLAIDKNNPGVLLVTLGNYGETNYIYYSTIADTTTSTSLATNFKIKQGNLPHAPVYASLIHYKGDTVFIGNEFGVFVTTNINAQNPEWVAASEGLDPVPVFQLRQQKWPNFWAHITNEGTIYAATHGRGLWVSNTFSRPDYIDPNQNLSYQDLKIRIFPNPAEDFTNISFKVQSAGTTHIAVYSISGKLILQKETETPVEGMYNQKLDVSSLPSGTYIVSISNENTTQTAKFLKK